MVEGLNCRNAGNANNAAQRCSHNLRPVSDDLQGGEPRLTADRLWKAPCLTEHPVSNANVNAFSEGVRQALLDALKRCRRCCDEGLHALPQIGDTRVQGELLPVTGGDFVKPIVGSSAAQRHGELCCFDGELILAATDDRPRG